MRRVSIALLALAMVAAACGSEDEPAAEDTTTTTTEAPATTVAPEALGATVTLASSDLGEILVDGDGNTLY
ncbi:MAG: hypothetical protein OEQ47_11130, partial [Acidimicrobiia bacterium]|nr:hypothetical protein [Acidimicrobiia bacterium]